MSYQRLKPFFTYYGAKYRIGPKYPPPTYRRLVEPFAGSAGYSVRYYWKQVELYDVHPAVYGTWDYLIKVSPQEVLKLPLAVEDVRDLKIPQEARWLIGWWLNKGSSSVKHKASSWLKSGIRPNSMWGRAVRERIARQVPFIRHWKVFNASWESCPVHDATWFIDPPYQVGGSCYTYHDIDYKVLSTWVQQLPGLVIACGQSSDTWLPFRHFHNARGQAKKSSEVVWTNRWSRMQTYD